MRSQIMRSMRSNGEIGGICGGIRGAIGEVGNEDGGAAPGARRGAIALVLCIPLLLAGADLASAATGGAYVSAHGGWATFDDADDGLGTGLEMTTDDDFTAGGAIGVRGSYYRVEGALDYVEGKFTSLRRGNVVLSRATDDFTVFSIMANAYAEYPLPYVTPYIGAGVGLGFVEVDFETIPGITEDDQTEELVWNVMAGASVPLSDRIEFFTGYRFFAINDTDGLASHQVQVGLRFVFGSDDDVDSRNLWNLIDPYLPDLPDIDLMAY